MLPDMRTVYIAGPFGDPDRKVREWNIERPTPWPGSLTR